MNLLLRSCYITLIIAAMQLSLTAQAVESVLGQKSQDSDEEIGSINDEPDFEFFEFDDAPLEVDLVLPDWFKLSFLELSNDLQEAKESGKRGLIVYFGQKNCAYCKSHLKHNWENPFIVAYTRKYFDVVAIDVRGDRPVADVNGKVFRTEKIFSRANRAQFTPTLIFYSPDGKEMLRLSGYHSPYQFKAVLEYVADGHYKNEKLKDYFARASEFFDYGHDIINSNDIFSDPPYAMDRSLFPSQIPLAVFFEKSNCHACDVMHAGPLSNNTILHTMTQLEAIQLDMESDVPVIAPDGERTTAKRWANKLEVYYTPTLIFFDERGKEIIRINSVVGFYRLNNVLHYILSKGYLEEPNFQLWRQRHRR